MTKSEAIGDALLSFTSLNNSPNTVDNKQNIELWNRIIDGYIFEGEQSNKIVSSRSNHPIRKRQIEKVRR